MTGSRKFIHLTTMIYSGEYRTVLVVGRFPILLWTLVVTWLLVNLVVGVLLSFILNTMDPLLWVLGVNSAIAILGVLGLCVAILVENVKEVYHEFHEQ